MTQVNRNYTYIYVHKSEKHMNLWRIFYALNYNLMLLKKEKKEKNNKV